VSSGHVHQFYLIVFIDIIQFGERVLAPWKGFTQTESQVLTAVHSHKYNILIPFPARFHLNDVVESGIDGVARCIKMDEYRVFALII